MQDHPQAPPATALDPAFASLRLGPSAPSSSSNARADAPHQHPAPAPAPRQARTPSAISVTPWMRPLFRTPQDRARPPIDLLDEEVASFVACVRPTKGEQRLRLAALTCLVKVVEQLWPTATVELFGSLATGLYLPHGDFDLVISDPSLLTCPTQLLLRTLRDALLASHLAPTVRLVQHAKVPLVKLVTAPQFGSFACDVSFNADKGQRGATESLRLLQELESRRAGDKMRAKTLVFVLKALLDAQGLNEVRYGGLGGLSIFCLAVSFVQLDPRPPGELSPGRDLLSFLYHYGWTHNYRTDCIVTAGGGRITSKTEFGFGEQQGHEERLSIQHPVDLTRDLTSGSFEIGAIVDVFRTAYLALSTALSPQPPLDGASPPQLDPTESLLGLAGLTLKPEVLVQRDANQSLLGPGGLEERARNWEPRMEGVRAAWARQRGGGGAGGAGRAPAARGGYRGGAAVGRPPVYAHLQQGASPSPGAPASASAALPPANGGTSSASPGLSRFGRAQYAAQGYASPAATPYGASSTSHQYHYGGIQMSSSTMSTLANGNRNGARNGVRNGVAAAFSRHYPAATLPQNYFGDGQASSSARSSPSTHTSPTSSFSNVVSAAAPPAPSPSWHAYIKDHAAWLDDVTSSPGPHRPEPVPPLAPTAESARQNPLIPRGPTRNGKPRKLQYTAL
ncbi:hypothetical protein JCM9279_003960 [Rhodotorula babjevae]